MKKGLLALVVVILAIVLSSYFAESILIQNDLPKTIESAPKAYVGVTYCGDSVTQAEQLIDKVKGYTNLFVLQSGLLEQNFNSVNEIGNYAVDAGMYFLPYFGTIIQASFSAWLDSAKQKWGSHLIGVYYSDEPGGKMLDGEVNFVDPATGDTIQKTEYGDVVVQTANGTVIQYEIDGVINLYQPDLANNTSGIDIEATFYPNDTIVIDRAENGLQDFAYSNYQQLEDIRPLADYNATEQMFVNRDKSNLNFLNNSTTVFTSDYALDWFDYLSGYDVVLSQIGWNLSFSEQIAEARGAAMAQNKEWGVIITWKYQNPPYLDTPSNILQQMTQAYECGAKYLVVFNYYDTSNSTNVNAFGTLTSQDYQALQTFWRDVLNNPKIVQGSIKANAVIVFPGDFGWGARWDTDHIWGIFQNDSLTEQDWNTLQNVLQKYGLQTDIVYEDSQYPISACYQNVYWCTSTP